MLPLFLPLLTSLQGKDYSAAKSGSELTGDSKGREIWTGQLTGEQGFLQVVWNEACDPSVFRLDVQLDDDELSNQRHLKTVPCAEGSSVPNCLWTVAVTHEARYSMLHLAPLRIYTNLLTDVICRWLCSLSCRDEADSAPPARRLIDAAVQRSMATAETQALDDDIALLSLLMAGDGDADDHFHAHGGRR